MIEDPSRSRRSGDAVSFRLGVKGLPNGTFLGVVIFMREIGWETVEAMVIDPEKFDTAAEARDHAFAEGLRGRDRPALAL